MLERLNQSFQNVFQAPKLKMNPGPEPATTGSEEIRWARVNKEKKRLAQENAMRGKKRRLVCFTCWAKDGRCCCNIFEVDADHPVVNEPGNHHWRSSGGSGRCNEIPEAVRITNDGRNGP